MRLASTAQERRSKRERILRLVQEVTAESDLESAVSATLKSYIEQKLAAYERAIRRYERKYSMTFSQFSDKLRDKKIVKRLEAEQGILELEDDYFDWEGLVSEVAHLHQKLQEFSTSTQAPPSR